MIKRVSKSIISDLQTLSYLWSKNQLSFKLKWVSLLQLTAWINFLGLPFLGIIIAAIGVSFVPETSMHLSVEIAVISIYLHFLIQYFLFGFSTNFQPIKQLWGFFINLSSVFLSAFCWWNMLVYGKKDFKNRDTYSYSTIYRAFDGFLIFTFFSCGLLISQIYFYVGAFICIAMGIILLSKILLLRELKKSKQTILGSIYQQTFFQK